MRRIITYFRQDMKIRTKLFLNNILLVVLPVVLVMLLFYNRLYASSLNEVLHQRRSVSESCARELGEVIGRMQKLSESVIDNRLAVLLGSLDHLDTPEGREALRREASVFQMILSSHRDAEEIGSIRIYTEEDAGLLNGAAIPEEEPVFAPFAEIRYNYWTNLMKIRGENRAVFSGYYLTDQERDRYGSLSFVNRMTYYRGGEEREAYIVIYHDITMLRGILEAAVNLPGESAYLVDGQNIRVAFTDANDLGVRTVDYEKLEEVYGGGRDFERLSLGLGRQYFRYQDVPNSDWRLEWIVPEDSLAGETRGLLTQFVVQYSVILVFAFLLSMLVSRSILNRLYYLKKQMHFVREQRPVPVAGEYGRDIVGELIETYNDMTEKINAQIDKELKINGELYEYRLQALRAQIDPHFLYNTLDMIKWLAKKGKNEEVEEMVVTLARFYRLSLNKGHANIRLGEELEQVSLYVKLMNKRFGDTIDFFIDVPEELADREIPMMVFQPIVENAIVHGILEKEPQEGSIAIVGWEDEETLHFEVADDGVGMSADLLEKIAAGEQVSSTGGGIGVKNTKRRLELLYGKEPPVLWYESRPGEGTTVHMEMRKEKETWA